MQLATIGVYGFTLEEFLRSLRDADARLVLDVRQRRGVRGPQYAWANSTRLQAALEEAGIDYQHHPELAPTTDMRQLQYREDDRLGVGSAPASSSRPRTASATQERSWTAPIWTRWWRSYPRRAPPHCSASSATPKPVTARSSQTDSPPNTRFRSLICDRRDGSHEIGSRL